MKRILVVCPSGREAREVAQAHIRGDYEVVFHPLDSAFFEPRFYDDASDAARAFDMQAAVASSLSDLASFSADGRAILTKAKDGTARRWIIDATALRDQLRSTTAACLTPDQRRRYLSEPMKDAEPKWEACERAHGRDPRRHPSPNGEGAGSSTG